MTPAPLVDNVGGHPFEKGDSTINDEVNELAASRARVIAAADAERRRIERALHDGAQQDLAALSVNLQLARELLEADPAAARTLLEEIGRQVRAALEDVRELAWSIYPPVLDRGLARALNAAVYDAPVPARIDTTELGPHASDAEAAVYFVCAEAIAGATSRASVRAWTEGETLLFEVVADGEVQPGPTDARDRLDALGGAWEIADEDGGSRLSGRYPRSAR